MRAALGEAPPWLRVMRPFFARRHPTVRPRLRADSRDLAPDRRTPRPLPPASDAPPRRRLPAGVASLLTTASSAPGQSAVPRRPWPALVASYRQPKALSGLR